MTASRSMRILAAIFLAQAAAIAYAGEYNLAEYLGSVERNNIQLRVARNGLSLADTDVAKARADLLPSIAAQGGYSRNLKETETSTAVAANLNAAQNGVAPLIYQDVDSNYDNEFSLAVSVNQKILSPASIASYEQAKKNKSAKAVQYEATRRGVISGAKKTYAQAELTRKVLEVRESAERTAEQNYQNAKRRFEVGSASELDVLMAESSWRSSVPNTAEARKNAAGAMLSLKTLAGIPLDEDVVLTEKRESVPALPENADISAILASRPDYAAVGIAKDVADIARKAALAAFLPTVSGSFTYAAGQYRGYESASDTSEYATAKLGLSVSVPLSTGGFRVAQTKAASIAQETARLNVDQKRSDIETEIRTVRLSLEEAHERIDSARIAESTARRAADVSRAAYEAGGGTQLTVSDAEDRYRQAQLGLYNAVFGYLSAYYDWELATGTYR